MARQSKRIYRTGDVGLDHILASVGDRLDALETIRPLLEDGYLKVTNSV